VASNRESDKRSGNGASEPPKFEEQLGALEVIVTDIDSGELSLEEAISAFERGVGLVRSLNQRLDEAERRVESLMRGAGSSLKSVPLDLAGGAGPDESVTSGDYPPPPATKEDDDIPF
jgi:exodeoxyribonuclease VII small subunit